MNIKKDRLLVFKHFVQELATLSKCKDKQVACIIVNADGSQVYSIGVNGGPKGGPDCLCDTPGKYTCVHAEANAVAKCTVADPYKIAICSYSPCVTCASLLLNSGISTLYYIEMYKNNAGIKLLQAAGVKTFCIGGEEDG